MSLRIGDSRRRRPQRRSGPLAEIAIISEWRRNGAATANAKIGNVRRQEEMLIPRFVARRNHRCATRTIIIVSVNVQQRNVHRKVRGVCHRRTVVCAPPPARNKPIRWQAARQLHNTQNSCNINRFDAKWCQAKRPRVCKLWNIIADSWVCNFEETVLNFMFSFCGLQNHCYRLCIELIFISNIDKFLSRHAKICL